MIHGSIILQSGFIYVPVAHVGGSSTVTDNHLFSFHLFIEACPHWQVLRQYT